MEKSMILKETSRVFLSDATVAFEIRESVPIRSVEQ